MATATKKGTKPTTLVPLKPKELRLLPKPRHGFLAYARPLIAIYRAHPVEVNIKGQTPDQATEEVEQYEAVLQMESDLEKQLQLVRETRALLASKVWTTEMNIYACGLTAARNDVAMEHDISDFAKFMKSPRKKAPVADPPPTVVPVTEAKT